MLESERLELVEHFHRPVMADSAVTLPDRVAQLALVERAVKEPELARPDLVKHHAPNGRLDHLRRRIAKDRLPTVIRIAEPDVLVNREIPFVIPEKDFLHVPEQFEPRGVTLGRATTMREIVHAQRNVLCRRGDWLAAGRREDVVRGQHQQPRFHLRLD